MKHIPSNPTVVQRFQTESEFVLSSDNFNHHHRSLNVICRSQPVFVPYFLPCSECDPLNCCFVNIDVLLVLLKISLQTKEDTNVFQLLLIVSGITLKLTPLSFGVTEPTENKAERLKAALNSLLESFAVLKHSCSIFTRCDESVVPAKTFPGFVAFKVLFYYSSALSVD